MTTNDAKTLQFPVFHAIAEASRAALMTAGKQRVLGKGDLLCMHGAPLRSVFLVLDGAVRTFRQTPDGKEITVAIAMPGEVVGADALAQPFTQYQWSAAAAEASTVVVEYARDMLRDAVRNDAVLALNLLAQLALQNHYASVDAEQLVHFSAAQRVACFLLRLCALYGLAPAQFTLPFAKGTIASKLGMEVETFSRALAKLKELGVSVKGAEVRMAQVHALECFACGHCSTAEDCATLATLHERCGDAR